MGKIKYIKDGKGRIIAQERDNLLQKDGAIVARFNKGTNTTINARSQVIGYGDQRLTVLGEKVKKDKK